MNSKKMKRMLILFFSVVFLMTCVNTNNLPQTETGQNKNLIPFLASRSASDYRYYGYLDEGTGKEEDAKIVIEAQYDSAGPFIGDFAVVSVYDKYSRKAINKIINRNNKQIYVDKFDEAYLFTSENGRTTIALLEKETAKFLPPQYWHFAILVGEGITVKDTKQRLVNLTTGEIIIPEQELSIEDLIEVAGEYFSVLKKLYRFHDNGKVQRITNDKWEPAQSTTILKYFFQQRGINAIVEANVHRIDIDYSPYIDKIYANPDFTGAFEKLRSDFTIPFQGAEGLYRDPKKYLNVSIEITGDRRYVMSFQQEEPYLSAKGIYNETRKEWEIEPYLELPDGRQYTISDIKQTNNPHVFELNMNTVPHDPRVTNFHTVINTITKKTISGKVCDTNDSKITFPCKGGVWYYYDAEMD
jgi:hypothetical protein